MLALLVGVPALMITIVGVGLGKGRGRALIDFCLVSQLASTWQHDQHLVMLPGVAAL